MKRIKKSSKIGNYYLRLYEKAEATSVEQFYKQPSSTKLYIEQVMLWKMEREQGKYYKVISGNSFCFTAAWIAADGLHVETPHKTYLIC
jgi:hypothetical protein